MLDFAIELVGLFIQLLAMRYKTTSLCFIKNVLTTTRDRLSPLPWHHTLILTLLVCMETNPCFARVIEYLSSSNTTEEYYPSVGGIDRYHTLVIQELGRWGSHVEEARDGVQHALSMCSGLLRVRATQLCDPSGVLTKQQGLSVQQDLALICRDTHCPCEPCPQDCSGYRVTVTMVTYRPPSTESVVNDRVRVDTNVHESAVYESAGYELVGYQVVSRDKPDKEVTSEASMPRGCEDYIAMYLFVDNEPQLYTVVGGAVLPVLTPFCTDAVRDATAPLMASGRYTDAIHTALNTYRLLLQGGTDQPCRNVYPFVLTTGMRIGIIYGIVSLPLMLCVVLVFLGPCFRGRGFGGSKQRAEFTFTYSKRLQFDT